MKSSAVSQVAKRVVHVVAFSVKSKRRT